MDTDLAWLENEAPPLAPRIGPRYERPMSAAVVSRRRRVGVNAARVRRDAARLLALLGVEAELSVALIGDDEMQALNARYRRKDRPTDVLSFGAEPDPAPRGRGRRRAPRDHARGTRTAPPPLYPPRMLGDVVISVDTAARQAAAHGVSIEEEVRRLLAHGVLHLLGYDHERSAAEARRMFAQQRRLLRRLWSDG